MKHKGKADLLELLIKKNGKAMTRTQLATRLQADDRTIRQWIAELRDENWMIGTSPSGGYSFGNKEDFERTIKEYEQKRNDMSGRIRRMRKTSEMDNQLMAELCTR